jgi:hypothetical protein
MKAALALIPSLVVEARIGRREVQSGRQDSILFLKCLNRGVVRGFDTSAIPGKVEWDCCHTKAVKSVWIPRSVVLIH